VLFAGTAAAANESNRQLLSAVENCLSALETRYDEDENPDIVIAVDCPGLARSLKSAPISSHLHPPLSETDGQWRLLFLRNILDAAATRGKGGNYAFDHAGLDELLSGIYKPASQGAKEWSWWQAFREWLRKHFPKIGKSPELNRFAEWLDALLPSARTVKFLLYGSLATIFITALVVLLLEIRASGLAEYIRYFSRGKSRKPGARLQPGHHEPDLAEIRKLPLSARMPALLKLCIATLARRKYVASDRGITNRELLRWLQRNHPILALPFEQLMNYAEYCIYGGREATEVGVEDSFKHATSIIHAPGA
jgi:hypothetical protein